jgi:tryptophan halogenase
MSTARELPRRVVVCGAGQVGALAAVAVKRALPQSDVLVVGTPPDPEALADRAPTALPFSNRLHDRLGIAEERLVREAGATHRLVVRYNGWGGAGQAGVAPYGDAIDPNLRTRFARDWGGGPRNASTTAPPGSLGEVLATEGRFQPPAAVEPNSPLAALDYALRWNSGAYRNLLIGEAQRLGVQYLEGAITAIGLREGGGIDAIGVGGASEGIDADLYLDCTGTGAALLSQLPEARWQTWQPYLPIRGLQFGQPGGPALSLADSIELTPVGWRAELVGRDATQHVLAMVEGTQQPAARAALGTEFGEFVAVDPGRTETAWIGNVVALGDAAATFEPLGWFNLDLAHRQLALLLELLPGRTPDPLERAEFNRRAGLMADRVRDLLGAHYAAPGAAHLGTPAGPLAQSPELALELDQYRRRGRLPFFEEGPLAVQEASALFEALGHQPGVGALSLCADPREGEAARQKFEATANAALRSVPPYGAWLRQVLGG